MERRCSDCRFCKAVLFGAQGDYRVQTRDLTKYRCVRLDRYVLAAQSCAAWSAFLQPAAKEEHQGKI